MDRKSLNLSEIFKNDDSRGNLLAEFLLKRRGMLAQATHLFQEPGECPSFTIKINKISTKKSIEKEQILARNTRSNKGTELPSDLKGVEVIQSNEKDRMLLERKTNRSSVSIVKAAETLLTSRIPSNNSENTPCSSNAQVPVVSSTETLHQEKMNVENISNSNNAQVITIPSTSKDDGRIQHISVSSYDETPLLSIHKAIEENKQSNLHSAASIAKPKLPNIPLSVRSTLTGVSPNDRLRRRTLNRLTVLNPARRALLEEVDYLEKTEQFEPIITSTPCRTPKSLSTLTNVQSIASCAKESNCSNTRDIERIEKELQNAFDEITTNKSNGSNAINIEQLNTSKAKCNLTKRTEQLFKSNKQKRSVQNMSGVMNVNENEIICQQNEPLNRDVDNGKINETESQILQLEIGKSISKNNLGNTGTAQSEFNEIVSPEFEVQQSNFKKSQLHMENGDARKSTLESSQKPINLGNEKNLNNKRSPAKESRNHEYTEPLMNKMSLHYKKVKKMILNKAPGVPLNGEKYAKELARLTNNEILDLRKRNSLGEIFKEKSVHKSSVNGKRVNIAKQKQQELEQLINFELLKRDVSIEKCSEKEQQQLQHEKEDKEEGKQQHQQQHEEDKEKRKQQEEEQREQEQKRQVELELDDQQHLLGYFGLILKPQTQCSTKNIACELVEKQQSEILTPNLSDVELLAAPSPFRDVTVKTKHKRSPVEKSFKRDPKASLRNSRGGTMSDVLQHYMEIPEKIRALKSMSRQSKRSLYSIDNSGILELEQGNANSEEHEVNKSAGNQKSDNAELLDSAIGKETSLQVFTQPLPFHDITKKTRTSLLPLASSSSQMLNASLISSSKVGNKICQEVSTNDNHIFKSPKGLPPKKQRQPKKPKHRVEKNNSSQELRRSSRAIVPNKSFQFVQEVYDNVMEKKLKHSSIRNSVRSITPSFGRIKKSFALTSVPEERSFVIPTEAAQIGEEKNAKIKPLKESTKKSTAIITKKRTSKIKATAPLQIDINRTLNVPISSKKIQTSAMPENTAVQRSNKEYRKKRYTKKTRNTLRSITPSLRCTTILEGNTRTDITEKSFILASLSENTNKCVIPTEVTQVREEKIEKIKPLKASPTITKKHVSKGKATALLDIELNNTLSEPMSSKKTKTSAVTDNSGVQHSNEAVEDRRKKHAKKRKAEFNINNENKELSAPASNKRIKTKGNAIVLPSPIPESSEHNEINLIEKVNSNNVPNTEEKIETLSNKRIKKKVIKRTSKIPTRKNPSRKVKMASEGSSAEKNPQVKQATKFEEQLSNNKNNEDYSHITLQHFNKVFDSFNEQKNLPEQNYSRSDVIPTANNHKSAIPSNCRKCKVKIKKLKNPSKSDKGNASINTTKNINGGNTNDSESLQNQTQQVTSSLDAQTELITWLKTVQETEIFSSSKEIFKDVRISPHSNLCFNKLQDIEYAFYNTDDAASLGYLRFKPRQTKSRKKTKHYVLHFITIVGKFCFTINDVKRISTVGDMVAIQKLVFYEIENLTNDIGILMVIKK